MIAALRSEFRKILTTRSTYGIILFCFALLMLFAFYLSGYRLAQDMTDANYFRQNVIGAVSTLAPILSLIGLLSVANEYRYNTILYTLGAARRRWQVLLAKVLAVSAVVILLTLLVALLSPALGYLGLQLKGLDMVTQNVPYGELLWKTLFYGWGYAMLALMATVLLRNQVGAIVFLFLFPITIESLLALVLQERAIYLPFGALGSVIQQSALEPGKAALVVLAYIAGLGAAAAAMFMWRDAN